MTSVEEPGTTASPAGAGVVGRLTLDPTFEAAGRARLLLRSLGEMVGQGGWLDDGELACTELITNAVLHAHTPIDVVARASADELLVEVRDRSPELPTQRGNDGLATTGRGMAMVAALASDFGIRDAGRDGKTAWFVVRADGEGRGQDGADLLAAWDEAARDDGEPAPGVTTPPRPDGDQPGWRSGPEDVTEASPRPGRWVQLQGLPPMLWLAAREHHNAVLRELALYRSRTEVVGVDLAATDRARNLVATAVWGVVERARRERHRDPDEATGHPTVLPWVPEPFDLDVFVPAATAACFAAMQDTLDVAERLAAAAELLAAPALPEVVAVRDWVCEQVIAQHGGAPATPWPGTDQERFIADVDADLDLSDWDLDAVRRSDVPVVAADGGNRIVAVSPALARLVGWEEQSLVGRRIVTLIPARLRETHVAGFTRHLSTGDSHVVGFPLDVPVLRFDGSEISCRLVVESVAARRGRHYLAHLSLAPPGEA